MNPLFLVLITGLLTLTSGNVLGVEVGQEKAKSNRTDPRLEKVRAEDESVSMHGPFVVAGASSGIEFATAVAIGVVGAALISYGEDQVQNGELLTSERPQDTTFASKGAEIRTTPTTRSEGTTTTIGIATTVSSTSTTTAATGTTSASAVSSTGSM